MTIAELLSFLRTCALCDRRRWCPRQVPVPGHGGKQQYASVCVPCWERAA